MTLKATFLDGSTGQTNKLLEAWELGRKFVLPAYHNITPENAITVSTTSPHVTIANAGTNAFLQVGYTIKYLVSGTEYTGTVASPLTLGSTFDLTVAPSVSASAKSMTYSSPFPSAYATLVGELQAKAASGESKFSISIPTTDNPHYLRLNGTYLQTYLAGIYSALNSEGIFSTYEVALSLDLTDSTTVKIKFAFSLC
jgi:hypothetical protein